MMRTGTFIQSLLATFSMLCLAATQASGDIIVSVGNASLNAGGTGFVDVMISGAPGDTLGRFGYEFNITGAVPANGDLQFKPSYSSGSPLSPLTQTNSEQGLGNYVFPGDTDPINFSASLGSGGTDPLTLVGGDALLAGNDVSINGTFLLARLELQHVGPFRGPSQQFMISLITASSFTEFDQDFDAGTTNNYTGAQISATSGTITVNAAAVPEPSSVALLAIGTIAAVLRKKRRAGSLASREPSGPGHHGQS